MRLCLGLSLLVVLTGISSAQDTNFSTGPQYLITFGSPVFAQSIATPSLSWDKPSIPSSSRDSSTEPIPTERYAEVSAALDAQRETSLLTIYYGAPAANPSDETVRLAEGEETSRPAPANVMEVGISSLTDAQTLRRQGYGITLAEAAMSQKATRSHAHHVYTNEDLERLRPVN